MIHQELSLVPELSAAENVFLGAEPARRGVVDRALQTRNARAVLDRLGQTQLDPAARVADLPLAARQMTEIAKAIGDKGDVGIVGEPDVQSTIDREAGFKEALQAHPNIHLVADLNGYGTRDHALKAADDMLQAHPNINAIFAINDESALGVLSSAQSHHAKVVIVGYDAGAEAQKAIAGGTQLKADVAQQPKEIGQRTIDAIADYLAGKAPQARIAVPVRIVDADSVKAMAAAPAKQ
jgi:ABC-type sugar transport system substrate-binding protein